jgi:predicted dienelactone hydrolase
MILSTNAHGTGPNLTWRSKAGRLAAGLTLAAGALGGAMSPAAAADNPFQRGPDPTNASIEATTGPFATTQATIPTNLPGFGGGIIYYPTSTSDGTFGAVAIAPGFTERWAPFAWLGPRLASQGFVVVGIETKSTTEGPPARGDELLAALDWAVASSPAASRIDASRLAVAGHSMGGGGTLEAANDRPALQAAIPLAPWDQTKSWPGVRVPTLIVAGESDTVAPPSSHAMRFYSSIPAASEKAYLELNNARHSFPNSPNTPTARMMISWLKRFVDNDTRYDQFLCPGPAAGDTVQQYQNTCPLAG